MPQMCKLRFHVIVKMPDIFLPCLDAVFLLEHRAIFMYLCDIVSLRFLFRVQVEPFVDLLVFLAGYWFFKRVEFRFADVV